MSFSFLELQRSEPDRLQESNPEPQHFNIGRDLPNRPDNLSYAVKAEEMEAWLDQVVTSCGVLPTDAASFREWARLEHRKPDTLIEDAMIAATARVHGLTVVTRNVKDYRDFDVDLANPFKPASQIQTAPYGRSRSRAIRGRSTGGMG